MTLQIIRLLFDLGLVVLIWITQLVVYPSFKYYKREDLLLWHKRYTIQITFIVMPLMLGQLFVSGIQLLEERSWYTLGSILIIAVLWAATFLLFVPLHNKISNGDFNEQTLVQLVRKNWLRTVLWTILFFISLALFTPQTC